MGSRSPQPTPHPAAPCAGCRYLQDDGTDLPHTLDDGVRHPRDGDGALRGVGQQVASHLHLSPRALGRKRGGGRGREGLWDLGGTGWGTLWAPGDLTSRISLILVPALPMSEPHWLAGMTRRSVTGVLPAAVPSPRSCRGGHARNAGPPLGAGGSQSLLIGQGAPTSSSLKAIMETARKTASVEPVMVVMRSGQEPSEMVMRALLWGRRCVPSALLQLCVTPSLAVLVPSHSEPPGQG